MQNFETMLPADQMESNRFAGMCACTCAYERVCACVCGEKNYVQLTVIEVRLRVVLSRSNLRTF